MAKVYLHVIGIEQGILARGQKSDISKLLVLAKIYWVDNKDCGGFPKIIKSGIYITLEQFWNNWGLGKRLS